MQPQRTTMLQPCTKKYWSFIVVVLVFATAIGFQFLFIDGAILLLFSYSWLWLIKIYPFMYNFPLSIHSGILGFMTLKWKHSCIWKIKMDQKTKVDQQYRFFLRIFFPTHFDHWKPKYGKSCNLTDSYNNLILLWVWRREEEGVGVAI